MFKLNVDDRLSCWARQRLLIDESEESTEKILLELWNFWKQAPFVPYNNKIDPFFQYGWPTPWDIIVDNKYDEFTRALMMGWTLKLTKKFKNSQLVLKTVTDNLKPSQYNLLVVNDEWVLNYSDLGPVPANTIPESLIVENIIKLEQPR
jgi:hypothetical protein